MILYHCFFTYCAQIIKYKSALDNVLSKYAEFELAKQCIANSPDDHFCMVHFAILCYSYNMAKKSERQHNKGQIIIPVGHPNPPEDHEIEIASILAKHFQSTVEFLIPIDDYMRKTADILMLGVEWEMKSPHGSSQSTIRNQLRRASKQSKNIIVDTRRTKLEYEVIAKKVLYEMHKNPSVKRVILIDKFENVIELHKNKCYDYLCRETGQSGWTVKGVPCN